MGKPHIVMHRIYRDWMCIGRLGSDDPLSSYVGVGKTPLIAYVNWMKGKRLYGS